MSYPGKLLYANNVVLIAESLPEAEKKFQVWQKGFESKDPKINFAKIKVLVKKKTNKSQIPPERWPYSEYVEKVLVEIHKAYLV